MQEEAPLISIIVPVYNVEKYLSECVNSLETQTIASRQIILVDDGSTDRSGVLCDEFAERFPDIQVIHKENGGLASARNAGLDAAIGTYVGFVDSDDYIAPDMYESLYQAIVQDGSKIACCNWYRCIQKDDGSKEISPPTGTRITEYSCMGVEETIKLLMLDAGITYSACDKLFLKSLFDEIRFPKANLPSEDIPCIYRVLKRAIKVTHIGETKYYYRVVANSISQSTFQEKNISTFHYMQEVYLDVCDNYSTLTDVALYGLMQSAGSVYTRLIESGRRRDFKEINYELKYTVRKKIGLIIKNPHFTRNAKICFTLIAMSLYPIFYELWIKRKNRQIR